MNKSSSSSAIIVLASVGLALIVLVASFVPLAASAQSDTETNQEPRELESIANAKVQSGPTDLASAAGSHYGKSHGKYYMYAEVPKKGAYKMGFKRGNEKHTIERKESVHKGHVESYFKWHDKKGKGSHKFEYMHKDSKKKHY